MKTVSISDLKAPLSEYVDLVRNGEEIVVTDRGQPVVRMLKVEGGRARDERRMRLARQGTLSLRQRSFRKLTPPRGDGASGVLLALLEERSGRR